MALRKHIVQEKIMYTSELSIYHTSNLFIQRIALFSIIIHRRVVRVGIQFQDHFCIQNTHFKFYTPRLSCGFKNVNSHFATQMWIQKCAFKLYASNCVHQIRDFILSSSYIHLVRKLHTQNRDFILSTRIVKFTSFLKVHTHGLQHTAIPISTCIKYSCVHSRAP